MLLQQTVNGRPGQAATGDGAGGFEQLSNLAQRAPRVVALGGENGGLGGGRKLRLPAVGACLGRQAIKLVEAPGVVPRLNRLLAQIAPTGAGDGVLAASQLPENLLQFATFQPLAADQGTEDGQAKQGFRINRVHNHSW